MKTIGSAALRHGGRFTLDEWEAWPDGERWELIGGVAYDMSPAPRTSHQDVAGRLYRDLSLFLGDSGSCSAFIAPLDVYLPDGVEDSTDTVVQPDVLVVCDRTKIDEDGVHGAPDFVAEVLSESTAYKDWNEKRDLYERSGVREYWIISTGTGSVFRFTLRGGRYGPVEETLRGDEARSVAFAGFSWVFPVRQ